MDTAKVRRIEDGEGGGHPVKKNVCSQKKQPPAVKKNWHLRSKKTDAVKKNRPPAIKKKQTPAIKKKQCGQKKPKTSSLWVSASSIPAPST